MAWQLAHELEEEVCAFTATPPASDDVKFCDRIREAVRSATGNTAEGFGRSYPNEFSRFLSIVAGSLLETKSHLGDARDRGYLSAAHCERLTRLTLRAIKANARLIAYLARCNPPDPYAALTPKDMSD